MPTGRGVEQFRRIRETLARAELNEGLTLAELAIEAAPRLPRDATVLAILPAVSVDTAVALGTAEAARICRFGDPSCIPEGEVELAYGRLAAEGIRDVRPLASEDALPELCLAEVNRTPYVMAIT